MKIRFLLIAAVSVLLGSNASAHRLDEYLQTAFFSLGRDRVTVELIFTPGVAVLPAVMAQLDANADQAITETERSAYMKRVLADLEFTLDGERLTPRLTGWDFPRAEDLREGIGSIHFSLELSLPPGPQTRVIGFQNHHQSAIAAYQVNCLLPSDPSLKITAETRSPSQASYQLTYSETKAAANASDWVSIDRR